MLAAFGAGPLLLVAGCGSSSGDGAGSLLSPIQPSSYVTILPATTTTTTTTTTIFVDPNAPAPTVSPDPQTYIVVAGDSLSKIAGLYEISVEALVNYNGWVDGLNHLLLPGDPIRIPPNSRIPGADTESDDTATSTPSDEPPACTHTIEAGENPTRVANKYDVTYDELQLANPTMDFTTTFVVGDEINIPANGNC